MNNIPEPSQAPANPSPLTETFQAPQATPSPEKKKATFFQIAALILLIIVAIFLVIFYLSQKEKAKSTLIEKGTLTLSPLPTSPKPRHTPYPLIPNKGSTAGTYNISQGPHTGPTFKQIIFDPLDVKKGQTLKISLVLDSPLSTDLVNGTLQSDNIKTNLEFQLLSRTGSKENWFTSILLTDTVDYYYIVTVNATDKQGTSTIITAPRSE